MFYLLGVVSSNRRNLSNVAQSQHWCRFDGKQVFGDHCADSLFIGQFEAKNCTKNTVGLHLHTKTVCNRFSCQSDFKRWTNSAGFGVEPLIAKVGGSRLDPPPLCFEVVTERRSIRINHLGHAAPKIVVGV